MDVLKKHVILFIPFLLWIGLYPSYACNIANEFMAYSPDMKDFLMQQTPDFSSFQYNDCNIKDTLVSENEDSIEILSNQFAETKGNLPWPVENGVIRWHHPPCFGNIHFEPFMDIVTEKGSKVRCIFNGRVVNVFKIPGNNEAVLIRHGDYFTLYSNLKKIKVKKGDFVLQNSKLGKVCADENGNGDLTFQIWHFKDKLKVEDWLVKKSSY